MQLKQQPLDGSIGVQSTAASAGWATHWIVLCLLLSPTVT